MSSTTTTPLPASILAQRDAFKAFLAARLGNAADAEDVLQASLARALAHSGELRESEKAVAWFYQLLRRAVVDHIRSRTAARRREDAWATEAATLADEHEAHAQICRCFEALLPALKPKHAELLRRVELQGTAVAAAAAALGISANHASVILHRARAELRAKLIAFCGACTAGACLDCDCAT